MSEKAPTRTQAPVYYWRELQPMSGRCGISVQPPGKTVESEWHSESIFDFDLWLILEGKINLFLEDGTRQELSRGGCIWLRPGVPFGFSASQEGPLHTAWVHFDLMDPKGRVVPCDQVKVPEMVRQVRNIPFFEVVFRHLVALNGQSEEEPAGRPDDGDEEQALRFQQSNHLLSVLLYEYELLGFESPLPGVPVHYRQIVDEVKTWLEHHPDRPVSAGELAQKHGYSLPHFSRIFRKAIGQSPTQVILEARIRQAKRLLLDSTLNISEVATSLGYDEVFYFSKQFKKMTGVSPLAFRRINRVP